MKLGVLDRVLGAIGNLLVTAFVVALVASGISAMGVPVLSPAIAGSRVLQGLDAVTPAPARSLLAELRTAALGEAIPWLVDVLDAPSESPARCPTGDIDDAVIARAAASVVRMTGNAFQCGSNLSGSGFVVAPDRDRHERARGRGGDRAHRRGARAARASPGRVVSFDRENDLALIAVDGLATPRRFRSQTPMSGPRSWSRATRSAGRSRRDPRASSRSARSPWCREAPRSTRDIMTLATDVDHGNSGGPVLTADGAVGGVVFAKSESVDDVGFAVPLTALEPLAGAAAGLSEPVDSGSCSAG